MGLERKVFFSFFGTASQHSWARLGWQAGWACAGWLGTTFLAIRMLQTLSGYMPNLSRGVETMAKLEKWSPRPPSMTSMYSSLLVRAHLMENPEPRGAAQTVIDGGSRRGATVTNLKFFALPDSTPHRYKHSWRFALGRL